MKDKLLKMLLSQKIISYASSLNTKFDLVFYLLFIVQTSTLLSVPSGFHSANPDGWLGFGITLLFTFIFYPFFYLVFYQSNKSPFLREVIIFSVVARFSSVALTGVLALIQIGLWELIRLEKIPQASLIYYVFYYLIFSFLMVSYKKNLNSLVNPRSA